MWVAVLCPKCRKIVAETDISGGLMRLRVKCVRCNMMLIWPGLIAAVDETQSENGKANGVFKPPTLPKPPEQPELKPPETPTAAIDPPGIRKPPEIKAAPPYRRRQVFTPT